MNPELWAIGLTGAAVGGALGWPLVRRPAAEAGLDTRLLGVMLLLGAVAAALIAAEHGNVLPPLTERMAAHLISFGDLVFWSLLVLWIRGATGRETGTSGRGLLVALPLVAYAVLAVAHGGRPPRFIWLLPAGVAAAVYATTMWLGSARAAPPDRALASRVIALAWALNGAQAVRTFWPDVELLREIVPITLTAGFLSMVALAMRSLATRRRDDEAAAAPPARYERSALDEAAAAALVATLDRGMRDERWSRDSSLTLATLAANVGARPHAVSQALNQQAGRAFHEYVTSWRVAEARAQLEDPANDRFTIDALAEAAGFASRSAFYKAFKAAEGMTPTAFRARARRSDAMT